MICSQFKNIYSFTIASKEMKMIDAILQSMKLLGSVRLTKNVEN